MIVNGIIFLISLSDSLLLVYKNTTDFYILILYPATLPNSLMRSSSILEASVGFLCIVACHWQTVTVLLLPFQFGFLLFFSCLIAVAGTYYTMLNKSGKRGHPSLVPDLKGNAFSSSPLSMMLAVGLSYMIFIMLRYILSIPTFLRVLLQMDIQLCQKLFLHLVR